MNLHADRENRFQRRIYSSAYCELGDGKGNDSYFHECGSKRLGCEEVRNIGLEAQPGSESGKAANKYCKSAPPSIFFKRLPLDGNDRIPKINSSMAFAQTAHVDPASDAIVILHELCRQIRNFHA